MKIVLYQPQIPQNVGNIVRTCSVTGAQLVLIHPLGFSTQSRHLKRAGLDYWEGVQVEETRDLGLSKDCFFFSSKAEKCYTEAPFTGDSVLIFGSETEGLPREYWEKWPHQFYKVPMREGARCLNLASTVSIVLYEALRQTHFALLKKRDARMDNTMLNTSDVANGA